MAEPLKNQFFQQEFINQVCTIIKDADPKFDTQHFLNLVFDEQWEQKELKQRMRHITESLHRSLNRDYKDAIDILWHVAPQVGSFDGMIFPDFVECYGLHDWETSIPALEHFTQYSSSEFAVRPFIIQNPEVMMQHMRRWAGHENHHVRRLSSEGCRPRLPWAMALPEFKKDPSPIFQVLEQLKEDKSLYVRKSVANNLNDISKDHPERVLQTAAQWLGKHQHTDWIVKQACRTLLKQGLPEAMTLFGFEDPNTIEIDDLASDKKSLHIGEELQFSFTLSSKSKKTAKLRLEYAIDYVKKNGKSNRKVFQISENTYEFQKPVAISKKQSFQNFSTRKHYPGTHQLTVLVNGVEKGLFSFDLKQ